MMKRFILGAALSALATGPVVADVNAYLIGIELYDPLPRVEDAADLPNSASSLAGTGVTVTTGRNHTGLGMLTKASEWMQGVDAGDTIVVALAGHFATDGRQTWLLGKDTKRPNLISIAAQGLSLDTIFRVLSEHPGGAVLVLGQSRDKSRLSQRLTVGVGPLDIPQGVSVIRTSASKADDVVKALVKSKGRLPSSGVQGYAPAQIMWDVAETPAAPQPSAPASAEPTAWATAADRDTIQAYRTYLKAHPTGANAANALAMIREIETEPNRVARKKEEALELSRDARREIQRDLSVLDYNTRGIDGLFGPGSRGAIGQWQAATGLPKTGYLTANQIIRLDAQAERRVAQLEAEAERKRAQAARLDRAFWEETGAQGGEAAFRAYLNRYPDGDYAEIATSKLDAIAIKKRARAAKADQAAWDKIAKADTAEAYQSYLAGFPQGAFRREAEAKLASFAENAQKAEARQRYAAAEAKLNLSPSLNRMVELRLAQLGLKPGVVDGTFDKGTRRAIRRYQKDRNLDVTGYMNQATAVRMLSGGFSIRLK